MPIEVTFQISDHDLERLQQIASQARDAADKHSPKELLEPVKKLIGAARKSDLPEFIASRVEELKILVDMVEDEEWKLADDDLKRVLAAIAYFSDPEDLIPDRVPGLGFLDDAIMIELIARDLTHEIKAYQEFCAFRSAEEKRRANQGLPTDVSREDWLADRRAVLHSRMRERRSSAAARGGWRLSTW